MALKHSWLQKYAGRNPNCAHLGHAKFDVTTLSHPGDEHVTQVAVVPPPPLVAVAGVAMVGLARWLFLLCVSSLVLSNEVKHDPVCFSPVSRSLLVPVFEVYCCMHGGGAVVVVGCFSGRRTDASAYFGQTSNLKFDEELHV